MPAAVRHRRAGITLVELLVVIGIIGALAAAVLPNLGTTIESRRGRESARMLTSFIAKAQSRALGRREWSGFMISALGGSSYAAADLFLADVPPVYRGDTFDATVLVTDIGEAKLRNAAPEQTEALQLLVDSGVAPGDVVRFDGRGPMYELEEAKSSGFTFRLQGFYTYKDQAIDDLGYQFHNTPWPALSPVRHTFEIFRKPVPAGSPQQLTEGRIIDLQWSGVGPPQVNGVTDTYRRFAASAPVSSVSVVFDGTGRARQIVVGSARLVVTGPVFLLVGRADRVGQAYAAAAGGADDSVGANWQYADSHWIAIDPFTGVVRSAECKPQATTVIESQEWIRQTLVTGGG